MISSEVITVAEPVLKKILVKCRVTVKDDNGNRHIYSALFASTADAIIDAVERFGISKINAELIR